MGTGASCGLPATVGSARNQSSSNATGDAKKTRPPTTRFGAMVYDQNGSLNPAPSHRHNVEEKQQVGHHLLPRGIFLPHAQRTTIVARKG
jgi:hypothetical protein